MLRGVLTIVKVNPVCLASSLVSSQKGIMCPCHMNGNIITWCLNSLVMVVLKFSAGKGVGESIADIILRQRDGLRIG